MIYALGTGKYVELRDSVEPPTYFKDEVTKRIKQRIYEGYGGSYTYQTKEIPLVSASGWDGGKVLDAVKVSVFLRLTGISLRAGEMRKMGVWTPLA